MYAHFQPKITLILQMYAGNIIATCHAENKSRSTMATLFPSDLLIGDAPNTLYVRINLCAKKFVQSTVCKTKKTTHQVIKH